MIIPTEKDFNYALEEISRSRYMSFDTETTGIRPWHGDRLFGIAISTEDKDFYFDFKTLDRGLIKILWENLGLTNTIVGHNLKFDFQMMEMEGCFLNGRDFHDTMITARLLDNTRFSLSLDDCAKDLGLEKSKEVEEYIKKHKLFTVDSIPGKKTRIKNKRFDLVPLEVIAPYAKKDSRITYELAKHQRKRISDIVTETPTGKPSIMKVYTNEHDLLRVCLQIERNGIFLDREYVSQAIKHESDIIIDTTVKIEEIIGGPFVDSNKELQGLFPDAHHAVTEKGNPSFSEATLSKIDNDLARLILKYREHLKRKNTYFEAFRYYVAKDGRIHPNLRQATAETGRFSVTDPALQTLTKKENSDMPIRKAFKPTPGNCLVEIDYKAMEFFLMCDYAGQLDLIEKLKQGHDPHQATADMMGVTRREAKTLNFMLLYGGGAGKLAESLGITFEEATKLKYKYFSTLPGISNLIKTCTRTAKVRGFVFNFNGRRFHFTDPKFAYKATNALIQGSGADVCKIAMNGLDEFIRIHRLRTKIVLQIHDAILFDMPKEEFVYIKSFVDIMEKSYPHKHLPLKVSVEHSWDSWGELVNGEPSVGEAVQSGGDKVPEGTTEDVVCENPTSGYSGDTGFAGMP